MVKSKPHKLIYLHSNKKCGKENNFDCSDINKNIEIMAYVKTAECLCWLYSIKK